MLSARRHSCRWPSSEPTANRLPSGDRATVSMVKGTGSTVTFSWTGSSKSRTQMRWRERESWEAMSPPEAAHSTAKRGAMTRFEPALNISAVVAVTSHTTRTPLLSTEKSRSAESVKCKALAVPLTAGNSKSSVFVAKSHSCSGVKFSLKLAMKFQSRRKLEASHRTRPKPEDMSTRSDLRSSLQVTN